MQLGWILRHRVGRTTVFWSARGRAQRRRRFGRARRGKSLWHAGRQTHSLLIQHLNPLHCKQRGILNEDISPLKRMAVARTVPASVSSVSNRPRLGGTLLKSGRGLPQSKTLSRAPEAAGFAPFTSVRPSPDHRKKRHAKPRCPHRDQSNFFATGIRSDGTGLQFSNQTERIQRPGRNATPPSLQLDRGVLKRERIPSNGPGSPVHRERSCGVSGVELQAVVPGGRRKHLQLRPFVTSP